MNQLPIDIVLPELRSAFERARNVVLSAEPGAGKTTRVPLSLLNETWLTGKKIIMLEPRRLAAQRASIYMAQQLKESVGSTVGYRIRGDSRIGRQTRIEVVTEGILTRMLQDDASLPGIGIVIFDEFHERSIHADLGLALTLDVQEHLRNDLRILVMSATLDGLSVSALLGNAPVIKSEGRTFPVQTKYISYRVEGSIEPLVVSTILTALREEQGDVLVFLPGQREIRKVQSLLYEKEISPNSVVHSLFGDASSDQQQAALSPASHGKRKIILSTSIAETSLTIDGVRIVIDSGYSRSPKFEPRRGMSGLVTMKVSRASADQRRGRAGRQQPGVCYRLWDENQTVQLSQFAPAEILTADLAPLAMELAQWGDIDGKNLRFLDPLPSAHLQHARELLVSLGAIKENGKLTEHGKEMAMLPVHPRLANMILRGQEIGVGALACDVAALLEERDLLRGTDDIDLSSRWELLRTGKGSDSFAHQRIVAQTKRLRQMINTSEKNFKKDSLGILLALAYPERVAKRRSGDGEKYQLAGNAMGVLPKRSMLSREEYLAVGDVDGVGNEVRIFLAAPLTEGEIRKAFADQIITTEEVRWDKKQEAVIARRVTRFGAVELSEQMFEADANIFCSIMIETINAIGLDVLPWNKEVLLLQKRSEWLRLQKIAKPNVPNLSNEHLLSTLDEWLAPYLVGITRQAQLQKLDLTTIIRALFTYEQLRELDQLAPTHLTVPTGSRIPIDYSNAQPVLAVRLQEMFGEVNTPTVAGGKVKVLLHLLSPAHRPLAVTQDLPSFWKNAYVEVRKDMRGQYPKHYWPENPLEAKPTKRVKPRQ
ncbi:MAG: ATP-dependent helicase HrpB [Bacteroidota bacterium]|nr:ATP-dependent helicase HrpB [Bacteroidota bacterium]